jgi:hypothetical protein
MKKESVFLFLLIPIFTYCMQSNDDSNKNRVSSEDKNLKVSPTFNRVQKQGSSEFNETVRGIRYQPSKKALKK